MDLEKICKSLDEISPELLINKLESFLLSEATKLVTTFAQSSAEEKQKLFLNSEVKITIGELSQIIGFLKKGLEAEKINKELLNIINDAHKAYQSAERQDKGLREVGRILGLTTGKRQHTYDKGNMLWEYMELTLGTFDVNTFKPKHPMEKREAITLLTKKHGIQSENGCIKLLERQIKKYKDRLEYQGQAHGWKGLLPGRKD